MNHWLSKRSLAGAGIGVGLFWNVLLAEGPQVDRIEGLFYLDGTPISIDIAGERIVGISRLESLPGNRPLLYVAPGLIDNQVNGYVAVNFTSTGLTAAGVKKATRALWQDGVTTYLPTLITNSHDTLLHSFRVLAESLQDPEVALSVPGFHLEGPYISPEDGFRGSHLKDQVRPPSWSEFSQYVEAAGGKILQVTLAPEIPGTLEFIRRCIAQGIVVALGHHNASAAVIRQAVDEGAAISTHLGNGCANFIHRHDNPLWPQLADDRLKASIIADGFHLRPEEVQVFYKVKGPHNTILTSDVTHFAGMAPGEHVVDGRTLVITPEGMVRYPEQDVLAGAAIPLRKGIGNVMRFTGCSLGDAIRMATQNPAGLYGWKDRGEIRPGKRADLILFSLQDGDLQIHQTILAGRLVYERK